MKLKALSFAAAAATYGPAPHAVTFGLGPDGTVNVPRFAVPELLATGHFAMADGVTNDVTDTRRELEMAEDHELNVFFQSRHDPAHPQSNIRVHYFEAHKHPLSDKARALGADDIAAELDNLYQQHHKLATKGRGRIVMVPVEDKRAYALAYHDAQMAGEMPPPVPWLKLST